MLMATQTFGALYYNYYYTIPFRRTHDRHNNARHVFFLYLLYADQAPILLFRRIPSLSFKTRSLNTHTPTGRTFSTQIYAFGEGGVDDKSDRFKFYNIIIIIKEKKNLPAPYIKTNFNIILIFYNITTFPRTSLPMLYATTRAYNIIYKYFLPIVIFSSRGPRP